MAEKYFHQYHCQFRASPGRDVLHQHYVIENRSMAWLVEHFHTWYYCVQRWLCEANIRIRKPGDNGLRRTLDPGLVLELYEGCGLTIQEIVRELECSERPVRRALALAGATIRKSGPRPGRSRSPSEAPQPDGDGYLLVYRPQHPKANGKGRVRMHILVMEEKLGRLLEPGEVVHHRDENKSNNHPENLELFRSLGEHTRHHNLQRSSAKQLRALTNTELLELHAHLSTVEMAKLLGTSPASVQRDFHRRGLPLRPGPRHSSKRSRSSRRPPANTTPPRR